MHLGLIGLVNQLHSHSKLLLRDCLITWPVGARVWWPSLLCLLLKCLNHFHRFPMFIFLALMLCIFLSAFYGGFCLVLNWFAHGLLYACFSFSCYLLILLPHERNDLLSQAVSNWTEISKSGQSINLSLCRAASLGSSENYVPALSLTLARLCFALHCPLEWKSANDSPNLP